MLDKILKKLHEETDPVRRKTLFAEAAAEIRKAYKATGKPRGQWRITDLDINTQQLVQEANTMFYFQVEGLIYKYALEYTSRDTYKELKEDIIHECALEVIRDFPLFKDYTNTYAAFLIPRIRAAVTRALAEQSGFSVHDYSYNQLIKKAIRRLTARQEEVTPESIKAELNKKVCNGTILNALARVKADLCSLDTIEAEFILDETPGSCPDYKLLTAEEKEEDAQRVEKLLEPLTEAQRFVVLKRILGGCSNTEINNTGILQNKYHSKQLAFSLYKKAIKTLVS